MEYIHTTKTGIKIPISKMSDVHLRNTIAYIYRKANTGLEVISGADEMYADVNTIYGRRVKEVMCLSEYLAEYERRGFIHV